MDGQRADGLARDPAALDAEPKRWDLGDEGPWWSVGQRPRRAMIAGSRAARLDVMHGWGMTETSPFAHEVATPGELARPTPDSRYEYAMQGLPVPLIELRHRDATGPCCPGTARRWASSRSAARGRRRVLRPTGSDRFTDDGWFRTGDVVTINPRGYIRIRDRSKDVVKSGGEWISSVELENALMAHPVVAEAAVIAVPDPKWDERPLAVVVFKTGSPRPPRSCGDPRHRLREVVAPRPLRVHRQRSRRQASADSERPSFVKCSPLEDATAPAP